MSLRNGALLAFAFVVATAGAGLIAWRLGPAAKPQPLPAPQHVSTLIDLPGDPALLRLASAAPPRAAAAPGPASDTEIAAFAAFESAVDAALAAAAK